MSKLRPTLGNGKASDPVLTNGTAYLLIYSAVQQQRGLIHGQLHDGRGEHCAIGSYFQINKPCLHTALVDEVAAVNDSVPTFTNRQRRQYVSRWLRWKLQQLGLMVPGRKVKDPQEVAHADLGQR